MDNNLRSPPPSESFWPPSAFCINLRSRPDRWLITRALLHSKGFDFCNRLEAVDTRSHQPESLQSLGAGEEVLQVIQRGHRLQHWEPTVGSVGCTLSHRNTWKNMLDMTEAPYVLVFEDDVLPFGTAEDVKRLVQEAPEGWDILLLGSSVSRHSSENPSLEVEVERYRKVSSFMGLYAYVITRQAAFRCIEKIVPIREQLDWMLSSMGLNIWECTEKVVGINPITANSSDVQCKQPLKT